MSNDANKYLSADEMSKVSTAGLKDEIRNLNRTIMSKDLELLQLEAKLAHQKSEVVRHRLLIMKQEHEEARKQHLEWWKQTKAKHGFTDEQRIGYDPETGRIIAEEKDDSI